MSTPVPAPSTRGRRGRAEDDDWIIPSDSESTASLTSQDARDMANELGVSLADLGFSDSRHADAPRDQKPIPVVKTSLHLSHFVIGSQEAKKAVQDCLVQFRLHPGSKPVDPKKKSSVHQEMAFVKKAMREKGWKLWCLGGHPNFTPQWVRASSWKKLTKTF